MQMTPIMTVDIPRAVSGTEVVTKYEIGANTAPATQSDIPNSLYGLLLNADPPT
jgi:hypothetical protein